MAKDKTIKSNVYGIVVELKDGEEPITRMYEGGVIERTRVYGGGTIESDLRDGSKESDIEVNALESLILAHAVAGIDIESPAYIEGIETAVDACTNH